MTLATWKKEFYKKPAKSEMTKKQAIEHSLLKWEGLRKDNLKKHGVYQYGFSGDTIKDKKNSFLIDSESCALCVKFLRNQCAECPLAQVLGDRCDGLNFVISPYAYFTSHKNPAPMIKALKKALKAEESPA